MIKEKIIHIYLLVTIVYIPFSHAYTVAVFGGNGFVGRRVTENLVKFGCDVISVNRSGKPPSYYSNETTDLVKWISYDLNSDSLKLPKIDAAISCVGNVDPDPEWDKSTFFGLAFNDERLYQENGILNENAAKIAKDAGAERFIFLSVSYEVAKMVEGPLVGYMDGKRHAEHVAHKLFGEENDGAIVLGPSLIYGGKRFPKVGDMYRKFVESNVAKAYVGSNEGLRKLSSAPMEDWVEKTLFSSPINVEVVARVASAAALGLVRRDMVKERRQGFFNSDGKPVVYDNVIFVDGTSEIEGVDDIVKEDLAKLSKSWSVPSNNSNGITVQDPQEPPFEGALIRKDPYLFPLPVIAFFSTILLAIISNPYS